MLRISSSLYDGSLQFYYSSTLVSNHNWTVHLELSVHVISVFFTRCHTQPEPPGIKPHPHSTRSLASGNGGDFWSHLNEAELVSND